MPAPHVVNGAQLKCSMGLAPSKLVVFPLNRLISSNQPAANVLDHVPMKNILPFGMCTTPTNPSVASATSAAAGVLTPVPCIPVTNSPWAPGSPTVKLADQPALNSTSMCTCGWGGIIKPLDQGQSSEIIP